MECCIRLDKVSLMTSPLFPWLKERSSGVLLHPTSLPSDLGVGNFGKQARRLIDFLQTIGMTYWQMCPLGPTGFGDSPYQSFSAFAGNPYLIDLHPLVAHGLLKASDLKPLHLLPQDRVDYGGLYQRFIPVLTKAANQFAQNKRDIPEYGSYDAFVETHRDWLEPYAAYVVLKNNQKGAPWYEWPAKYRSLAKFKKTPLFAKLEPELADVYFRQYVFFGQLKQLRIYAKKKGIQLIGDIPIFVAPDSADVWANPELFQLNKTGKMDAVAGVPPDYFSPLGQLWGNPLYHWAAHKKQDYTWWIQRLKHSFESFDVIRLDHFRGFEQYWSVPGGAEDARSGSWKDGPKLEFFERIQQALPKAKLIAEDLGEITPDVITLREQTGLPGMAILQFAFGSGADNFYLPHNINHNCVVYPGSHDNDTTLGWYNNAPENARHHFRTYFNADGRSPQWDLIRAAYASVARLAIIPMQDLMNLDSSARFNTPGQAEGNWQWRFSPWQIDKLWNEQSNYLVELKELYNR